MVYYVEVAGSSNFLSVATRIGALQYVGIAVMAVGMILLAWGKTSAP